MTLDPQRLDERIDALAAQLIELAERIHAHPETRFAEHRAKGWLVEAAGVPGVAIEHAPAGLDTAFVARVGRGGGPRIAILAEYDALPDIGHACGHNLIAAGALGAFLALAADSGELAGSIELVGTPAEEGGGGKITLLDAGVFSGVDVAMMFHPFDRDLLAHDALASTWFDLCFEGKASHAAIAPWGGASALTACMDTFRLIDGQRVHLRDGARVHGFIKEGGRAPNIIPEHARCEFSVRARNEGELRCAGEMVRRCAAGAAMASGVRVVIEERRGYREMKNNLSLARRFGDHLRALGRAPSERDSSVGAGSTDMGDVSQRVPSIHPWLQICETDATTCHQREFAESAASARGMATMLVAAKAMARTALDLLRDPALVTQARAEFEGAAEAPSTSQQAVRSVDLDG